MENRGVPVVEVAKADSTTYPYHSPDRNWSSSWSDTTDDMEYDDDNEIDEDVNIEPDSSTSPGRLSGSTTPDNLSIDFGNLEAMMVRGPGYVEFEEQTDDEMD